MTEKRNPFHIERERGAKTTRIILSRFAISISISISMSMCMSMSLLFLLYMLRDDLHRLCLRCRLFGRRCLLLPWRRTVDSAVEARRAFPLDPALEVVLSMTHDRPTRTNPTDHAGYDSKNSDHCKNGDHGTHRPVARVGGVGFLSHRYGWSQLFHRTRHVARLAMKLCGFLRG